MEPKWGASMVASGLTYNDPDFKSVKIPDIQLEYHWLLQKSKMLWDLKFFDIKKVGFCVILNLGC